MYRNQRTTVSLCSDSFGCCCLLIRASVVQVYAIKVAAFEGKARKSVGVSPRYRPRSPSTLKHSRKQSSVWRYFCGSDCIRVLTTSAGYVEHQAAMPAIPPATMTLIAFKSFSSSVARYRAAHSYATKYGPKLNSRSTVGVMPPKHCLTPPAMYIFWRQCSGPRVVPECI